MVGDATASPPPKICPPETLSDVGIRSWIHELTTRARWFAMVIETCVEY